jgi:hypothetical protein
LAFKEAGASRLDKYSIPRYLLLVNSMFASVPLGSSSLEVETLRTIKFTYWKDDDFYIGYLNDYPDYRSQGMSKDELIENLRDLLQDLESDEIPFVRKTEELVVAL